MNRRADNFVNYQARALEFAVGDVVVPFGFSGSQVGRITAVWPAIGMADVEMPFGNRRWPVEDLQRFQNGVAQPPAVWMSSAPGGSRTVPVAGGPGRVATPHSEVTTRNLLAAIAELPYVKLADSATEGLVLIEWTPGAARTAAIRDQLKILASRFGQEVESFQRTASGAAILRLRSRSVHASAKRVASAFLKKSIYWASQDRKYKMTRSEDSSGQMTCPKCSGHLKRAVYKREDGASTKLYGCQECLFLIREDDILNHPVNLLEGDVV